MQTYRVTRHMTDGLILYTPGDLRDLDDHEAFALLRSGALVPHEQKNEPEATVPRKGKAK